MASKGRGIDMSIQKVWADGYQKEAKLRLKWFRKNEDRLQEIAEQLSTRTVSQDIKDQVKLNRQIRYQKALKYPRKSTEDAMPREFDPNAILNLMKPVDPDTRKLFYSGTQQDGRTNYLKARVKVLPEDRYYFPETTSFDYGWQMSQCAKTMKGSKFGKSAIIKDSFYRRGGVQRDPDWYREAAKISPTVCDCV